MRPSGENTGWAQFGGVGLDGGVVEGGRGEAHGGDRGGEGVELEPDLEALVHEDRDARDGLRSDKSLVLLVDRPAVVARCLFLARSLGRALVIDGVHHRVRGVHEVGLAYEDA